MIEIEKKVGPLNPNSLRQKYFTKDSMNIEFRKRQMFEVNKSNRVPNPHFISNPNRECCEDSNRLNQTIPLINGKVTMPNIFI
jgi:hypothetical protein